MSDLKLLDSAVFSIFVLLVAIPLNGYGWTWNVRYGWAWVKASGVSRPWDCWILSYYCGLDERKGLWLGVPAVVFIIYIPHIPRGQDNVFKSAKCKSFPSSDCQADPIFVLYISTYVLSLEMSASSFFHSQPV